MALTLGDYAIGEQVFVNSYYEFAGKPKPSDPKEDKEFAIEFYKNAVRAMPEFRGMVGIKANGEPDANAYGLIRHFMDAAQKHPINLLVADRWFEYAVEEIVGRGVHLKKKEKHNVGEGERPWLGREIYNQIEKLDKNERKHIDENHPLFHQLMMLDDPYYLVVHIVDNLGKRLDHIFDNDEARNIFLELYKLHPDFAVQNVDKIINPDLVKDIIGKDYFNFGNLRHLINERHDNQARNYIEYYKMVRMQHERKGEDPDEGIRQRFLNAMGIGGIDQLSADSIFRRGPVALARLAVFLAPGVLGHEDAVKVRKKLGKIIDDIEKKIKNNEKLTEAEKFVLDSFIQFGIINAQRKPGIANIENVMNRLPKFKIEKQFEDIINSSQSIDEALNKVNEEYRKHIGDLRAQHVDLRKIFYEIPFQKFGFDWFINAALTNHPIAELNEFKEVAKNAINQNQNALINQLNQNSKGDVMSIAKKINEKYGTNLNLSTSAKLTLQDAMLKAATIIKNHQNLPSSIIEQIESQFINMDDDFKSAYVALALDVGHKPINDLTHKLHSQGQDKKRTMRLASTMLQLAIDAGASHLARIAKKWVDPSDLGKSKEERMMERYIDPHGDPLEQLTREWGNRLIPLVEIGDVKYFIDVLTYKIFKNEGDNPEPKPVLNRSEINKILSKVDLSKVNKLASAIQGVDLQLDRAREFYNLIPLVKFELPSNKSLEKRIMFSPSDGMFYSFIVDESGEVVEELPPSMGLSSSDRDIIESSPSIKQQMIERIKQSTLEHYNKYKHEAKSIIKKEPTLIYADGDNIIYYFRDRLYKLDLSNLTFDELSKGEASEFKEYLYDIKPIEYEKFKKREEGYDLVDSVQIPGLRVSKFDIYMDPQTKKMKAKYFNSDLDAPMRLQDAIINRYLNLPELAKNNIFEIGGKKYIVTYDSKLKKYFIRDYDTKKYVSPEEYKKILMHVAYKTKEYKLPNGKTIIIAYNPLNNSYFMFDKDTGEEIKNMDIVKEYFKNNKKEIFYDGTKYIIYFDPIANKYIVTYADGQEVQSDKFKNKILKEALLGTQSSDFFYVGKIKFSEKRVADVYYHPISRNFYIKKDKEFVKADYMHYLIIMDYINKNNISLPNTPISMDFKESMKKYKADILKEIEEIAENILSNVDGSAINDAFNYIIEQIILSKSSREVIKDGVFDFFEGEKIIKEEDIERIIELLKDKLRLKDIDLSYMGNLLTLELIYRNVNKVNDIYNSFSTLVGHEVDIGEDVKNEIKNFINYINKLKTAFFNVVNPERRDAYERALDILKPRFSGYVELSRQTWKPLAAALLVKILRKKAYSFVSSINTEQIIRDKIESIITKLIDEKKIARQ